MRILKFNVEGQRITKDPNCDFEGLVPGSEGYLHAAFTFDESWDGCAKIAVFYGYSYEYMDTMHEHAVKLGDDNTCEIPVEVLKSSDFYISVLGGKSGYRIPTNKIRIRQEDI